MLLKGQCHEIFDFAEIFAAQGAPSVSLTLVANGKTLKGQCHEIFNFLFFSWISFPQAPEYTFTANSNFFEHSRRYLRLKVHHRCQWHRWQMGKIFKLKYFDNFVWTPFGNTVNRNINFPFKFTLKGTVSWDCLLQVFYMTHLPSSPWK